VLNRTYNQVPGITACVEVFSLGSESLFKEEKSLTLGPSEVKETTAIASAIVKTEGIVFVVLNLRNAAGKINSHNVYWLVPDNDFRVINNMPEAQVKAELITAGKTEWTIRITNNSDKIAFFTRSQLMADGEEVLPSFWSGNYVTLAPSESILLTVECPPGVLEGKDPYLRISGWNTGDQEIALNRK